MPSPAETLAAALGRLTVRAWRLHLRTPGVRATVPMLRGVWGAALKAVAADVYHEEFEGGDGRTPRYLLRPAAATAPGPPPAVEFLLFGHVDDHTQQAAWAAWDEAGRRGLGPDRRPFDVVSTVPLAWDATPLTPARRQPGFPLYPLPWPAGDPARPCRLSFPAPLRLVSHDHLIESPTLRDVTLAALRRVRALADAGAGEAAWAARDHWLAAADAVPWDSGDWRPLDLVRYSGSQRREVDQWGVAGDLWLPAGPGPLADLLAAAGWLHLGKGTVMGMGEVRVEGGRR